MKIQDELMYAHLLHACNYKTASRGLNKPNQKMYLEDQHTDIRYQPSMADTQIPG